MNSSSSVEALLTALASLSIVILIFRAGTRARRRSMRVFAFVTGTILAAVLLWNTAAVLIFSR